MSDSDDEIKPQQNEKEQKNKQSSYTYWVNNDPNFFKDPAMKPNSTPQRIQVVEESKDSNKIAPKSAWNASGTWEEKAVSLDHLKKIFTDSLQGRKLAEQSTLTFSSVSSVSGEAKVIHSRGKVRIGYHLDISLIFEDANSENEVKINFKEFADDGDHEFDFKIEKGDATALQAQIQKGITPLKEEITNILKRVADL
eukprot:TRINITY_DN5322_c0_g1_i1.p1 TRINITY_DN5322_c0_g1~~TRINITY_DN5322_c0_g1_i1.p1  ORF type:complete len:197 (-),score=48.70 TRINITY_DN5322_c0_g1_i1:62-652(-)